MKFLDLDTQNLCIGKDRLSSSFLLSTLPVRFMDAENGKVEVLKCFAPRSCRLVGDFIYSRTLSEYQKARKA